MEYPWRFEDPNIGDKVFAVTVDGHGNRYINEVTIEHIQDNSYHVKVVDGEYTGEIERSENWEEYNIGYWVEEFSIGSAMYFGLSLFLTLEEAMDELGKLDEEGEDHEQEL